MHELPKTILIVDDDEEIRDLLGVLVNSTDTIVHVAGSIAEAKAIIKTQQVDIILLDIFLPDGNGLSLLDYWKEIHNSRDHPCTIIMSAFGNWENYLSAFNHKVFYFLEKPFKITRVRSLLEDALKKFQIH